MAEILCPCCNWPLVATHGDGPYWETVARCPGNLWPPLGRPDVDTQVVVLDTRQAFHRVLATVRGWTDRRVAVAALGYRRRVALNGLLPKECCSATIIAEQHFDPAPYTQIGATVITADGPGYGLWKWHVVSDAETLLRAALATDPCIREVIWWALYRAYDRQLPALARRRWELASESPTSAAPPTIVPSEAII